MLKIAMIGAGLISWHHLTAWQKLKDQAQVVAIFDPDQTRAESRAREFGIEHVYTEAEQLLADSTITAYDIASPRETHASWVDAAADRRIAALCQKPMTPTLAESEALVQRVGNRTRFMVHENWRFRPWYRTLKTWIEAGEIGDLTLVRMRMFCSGLLPDTRGIRFMLQRQPFLQHEERLLVMEALIHHLDTLRYLCGEMDVVVSRTAHTVEDIIGETQAAIFLETEAGVPIEVAASLAAPGFPAMPSDHLEIVGSRATAILNGTELQLLGPEPRTEAFPLDTGYQASFDEAIRHFVHCLTTGQPFETEAVDNLKTLRLVEHTYEAAHK